MYMIVFTQNMKNTFIRNLILSYLPILAAAIATFSGGGSIAEHFRHLVRSQSQRRSTDQQIRIAI